MTERLQELQLRMEALENRHKEAVDSTLNQEEGLRAVIQAVAKEAKEYIDERLQVFEPSVVAWLQWSEKHLGDELKKAQGKNRTFW